MNCADFDTDIVLVTRYLFSEAHAFRVKLPIFIVPYGIILEIVGALVALAMIEYTYFLAPTIWHF